MQVGQWLLGHCLCVALALGLVVCSIPVIVDTDIGTDYDDAWALGLLLASPEVDVRLIVTATDNTPERAKIVAKFLTVVGRTDIPIGIGIQQNNNPVYPYANDFIMPNYTGIVLDDGVQAMVDLVNSIPEVTVLELAPATNLEAALLTNPALFAERVRVVAMSGSIYSGYGGPSTPPTAEYNVLDDIGAAKIMYSTLFERSPMTIAPLDTSDLVYISGSNYQSLLDAPHSNRLIFSILEQSRTSQAFTSSHSCTLYDVQAARMTFSDEWLNVQELPLSVNPTGLTVVDPLHGNLVYTSTSWWQGDTSEWEWDITQRLLSWNN